MFGPLILGYTKLHKFSFLGGVFQEEITNPTIKKDKY